jgi:predicted PurR-regulated permease PerM
MKKQMEEWALPGLAAVMGIVVILFILVIVLFVKLSKLRKSYRSLMNGSSNVNIEELLIGIQSKLNEQGDLGRQIDHQVQQIQATMKTMKSKVYIHRYSAFGDVGNHDLSFSIAILDEMSNGVVLTSIYGRDQNYIYAKPVQKGVSTYNLSPEEKEAIARTLQQA